MLSHIFKRCTYNTFSSYFNERHLPQKTMNTKIKHPNLSNLLHISVHHAHAPQLTIALVKQNTELEIAGYFPLFKYYVILAREMKS